MPRKKRTDEAAIYEARKAQNLSRAREISAKSRDIGQIPLPEDVDRRARCLADLRLFCETYFASTFNRPWGSIHEVMLRELASVVVGGDKVAVASPRGSGKTTLALAAALWGVLSGRKKFVVLLGAEQSLADAMSELIKTALRFNEALIADFPDACIPFVRLEGISTRCRGQLHLGEQTGVVWSSSELGFPYLRLTEWEDTPAAQFLVNGYTPVAGAYLLCRGLTGSIRGLQRPLRTGEVVRPDLAIIDDPQTDESAASASQTSSRERIISSAVCGLAGPGRPISTIMLCTVAREDDLSSRFLDDKNHPDWRKLRLPLVSSFPENMSLWETYGDMLLRGDRAAATAFYVEHRQEMDAGCVVGWDSYYDPGEVSGVQHAMSLYFIDPQRFNAEYQNKVVAQDATTPGLSLELLSARINTYPRATPPAAADLCTAFIDVHAEQLYYAVTAWCRDGGSGFVLDYGTHPTRATPSRDEHLETTIFEWLRELCSALLSRDWVKEDGSSLRIERCLIDAGWKQWVVFELCRAFPSTIVLPSRGRSLGVDGKRISQWRRRPGTQLGEEWFITAAENRRDIRHVIFDSNYWKSAVRDGLLAGVLAPGAITFFSAEPHEHKNFFYHLLSEHPRMRVGRDRAVELWAPRPNMRENHYFDCLVGTAVAASICGMVRGQRRRKEKQTVRLSELLERKLNKLQEAQ